LPEVLRSLLLALVPGPSPRPLRVSHKGEHLVLLEWRPHWIARWLGQVVRRQTFVSSYGVTRRDSEPSEEPGESTRSLLEKWCWLSMRGQDPQSG
jgi:hypothetical protein